MGFQFSRLRAADVFARHTELSRVDLRSGMVRNYDLIGVYTPHVRLYVPTFRGDDVSPSKLRVRRRWPFPFVLSSPGTGRDARVIPKRNCTPFGRT